LRQGSASIGSRRYDLHVRVYVLPRLRGQQAQRCLPELRRQFLASSCASRRIAYPQSGVNPARVQTGGVRASGAHLTTL
jgi:hypothetical protein